MAVETGIGSVHGYEEGFGVSGVQALKDYGEALAQYRRDLAEELGVSEEKLHGMSVDEINSALAQIADPKSN